MALLEQRPPEHVEEDPTRLVLVVRHDGDVAQAFDPQRVVGAPPCARPTRQVARIDLTRVGEVARVQAGPAPRELELRDGVAGMGVDRRERTGTPVGTVLGRATLDDPDAVVDQAIPESPDVIGIKGDGVPVVAEAGY